ncbi:MAG: TonB-dependent receptor [Gammaproteobacteria bacterium]
MKKPMRLRFALTILASCALSHFESAYAADPKSISIPAGDLATALEAYAKQAGVELVYSTDQLKGLRTKGVSGTLLPQDAVTKLLEGTSLEVRTDATGAMLIASPRSKSPSPPTSDRLDPDRAAKGDELDEVIVTGSHIKGQDPISPTIVTTRAQIEESGRTSLPDFLATIPQVYLTQNGQAPDASGFAGASDSSFNTAINLRGLGPDSTLTLINGRRLAPAGGSLGQVTDISGIPVAAIERMEIVPDGSSAIYGSDAIGGVVNIILRKRFDGVEIGGEVGQSTHGDPRNTRGSIVAGKTWGSGSVLGAYEHLELGNLRASDRRYSRYSDQRPLGGYDLRQAFAAPGTVRALDGNLNAVQAATGSPTPVLLGGLPGGNGTALRPGDVIPGQVNIAPSELQGASLIPGDKRDTLWLSAEQDVVAGVSAFATVFYSKRAIDYAGRSPYSSLTVPASNAFNPFGEAVRVDYRFDELTDDDQLLHRDQNAYALTAGAHGDLSPDWSWEVSATKARSDFDGQNTVQFNTAALAAALADSNQATALNVFGDGSAQNMQTLRNAIIRRNLSGVGDAKMITGILNGALPWLSLGGGLPRFAVGVENRRDGLEFKQDLGTSINDIGLRNRTSNAAFAELRLPVVGAGNRIPLVEALDFSLAARQEHYSDFGNAFSPKVGLLWRPHEAFAIRAAVSRSFKAPLLTELAGPDQAPFRLTSAPLADPKTGTTVADYLYDGNSYNPNLKPEKGRTTTLGVRWAPPTSNFSADLGYFDITVKDRVSFVSDPYQMIAEEDALPPGLVIRDASGKIVELDPHPVNASKAKSSGFDFSARSAHELGVGKVSADVSATYYTRLGEALTADGPLVSDLDRIGRPTRWRARLNTSYVYGGMSLTAGASYVPQFYNETIVVPGPPAVRPPPFRVASWTTFDMSLGYDFDHLASLAGQHIRGSLSVLNLFDRDPPFAANLQGFDPSKADTRGRFVSLALSKRF